MGEDKIKIQKKLYDGMKKHKEYRCAKCGDLIRLYDIEKLDFEYIANKRGGEVLLHTRCKEK